MRKKHKTKNTPPQRGSGNSKLGVGILRSLGILGGKTKNRPYRPYCPYRPSVFKTMPAQADSGISKLAIRPLFCWLSGQSRKAVIRDIRRFLKPRPLNGPPECLIWETVR